MEDEYVACGAMGKAVRAKEERLNRRDISPRGGLRRGAEQAWEELKEKFHHREGTEYLLYFWRPDESTPVTKSMMEDLADAYAVVSVPEALGTIIVYAKWPERGWEPNPWDTRHLIRHLVDRLRETTHE